MKDILTPSQAQVLSLIAQEKDMAETYVLSGGTALAAFSRSTNLPVLPHLIKAVDKEEVQRFFHDLAQNLQSEVIENG